jgi:F0F1-type ATP synthase assembly protein I
MSDQDRTRGLIRSLQAFQEGVERAGPAAAASYSLIGAVTFCGGAGYAIDAWRGTAPAFLVGGLLVGVVTGFYLLAKALWRR